MAVTDPTGYISIPPELTRGVAWKKPCRAATTANITIATGLNAGDTIDDVVLAAGDRVLVKDQSTGSQNGIYVAGATPTRAFDLDQDLTTDVPAEETIGAFVYVFDGTINGGKLFKNTNTSAPTLGSTSLTFAEFSPGGGSSTLPYFIPEDYGAVGDGTTDDYDAIRDCIDAAIANGGGVILFGPKTYAFDTLIDIDATGAHIHLWGTGNEYGPTILKMTSTNVTAIAWSSTWSDASRTFQGSVRDLMVQGPRTTTSGVRGIYAASNVNLDNVGVDGFYDGLYWDGTTFYSRARGCFFTNQGHASIVMHDTNNCTVDTCRMTGDPLGVSSLGAIDYGVFIDCGYPRGIANRVINSSIEYFVKDGININGGIAVEIVGNYFETQQSSSGYAEIRVGSSNTCYSTRIESNYLQGDGPGGFDAIAFDHATNTLIANNKFGTVAAIGISSTANTTNILLWLNHNSPAGTFSLPATSYTLDPANPPGGAPSTADYLVGTAQGGLSAEIVVGTTPGGELGNTWASPTVDATHSGSAHTDFIAKAIVDAKGDLIAATAADTVARVAVGTDGLFLKADSAATAGVSWGTPTGTGVGPILVTDTPAGSPLVFADLLQNEAGTDLLYADL